MNFVWFDIIYIYLNTICEYIPQYLTRSRRPHDLMKLFLAPSHCPCHCVSWNSFFGRRTGSRRTAPWQVLYKQMHMGTRQEVLEVFEPSIAQTMETESHRSFKRSNKEKMWCNYSVCLVFIFRIEYYCISFSGNTLFIERRIPPI